MEVVNIEFTSCSFGCIQIKGEHRWKIIRGVEITNYLKVISVNNCLDRRVGSQWRVMLIVNLLIVQRYFVFKMTVYFNSLLSRWNPTMSMTASKFFSLPAKDLFHARLISGTMSHQSKSVISNSCPCLNCRRASFSTVMTIFQHPF